MNQQTTIYASRISPTTGKRNTWPTVADSVTFDTPKGPILVFWNEITHSLRLIGIANQKIDAELGVGNVIDIKTVKERGKT